MRPGSRSGGNRVFTQLGFAILFPFTFAAASLAATPELALEAGEFEHFHHPYAVHSSPELDEELAWAVRADDGKKVRALIDQGANPFRRIQVGRHWEHLTHAATGRCSALRELLNAGCDPNSRSSLNVTPLYQAIIGWHPSCVRALLDDPRTSTDGADESGASPLLHWAILSRQIEVLALLLDHGAPIDKPDRRGDTPLHFAIRLRQEPYARLLISGGADVNALDHTGHSPLDRVDENSELGVRIIQAGGKHTRKYHDQELRERRRRWNRY